MNPDKYVHVLGCMVMTISTIAILARHPHRLAVVLPLTTPIWILLSSGYNEYYPFIAAAFLCILIYLSDTDMKTSPPWAMALLASSIGLLYAGFAPISLLMLLGYAFRVGPRTGLRTVLLSGIFAFILILDLLAGNHAELREGLR